MKRKLILPLTTALAVGALLIVGLGQGCGRWNSVSLDPSGDAGSSSTNTASDDPTIKPNTPTVALVYGKQVLDHYTSCIGSGIPSDRTLALYSSKQGTISETGAVNTLTAPMLMAATSIAGEVCQDLIDQEKTAPRIFIGFDFASTGLPAQGSLQDAMRRIARSCWSRDEDATEAEIIMNSVNSAFSGATGVNLTRDAALYMCTSMLGSLDSLVL